MLDLRGLFEKTGERILLDQKLKLTDLELSPSQAFCSPISVKGEICNRAGIVIIDAAAAFDFSAACDRCAAAVNRAFVIPIKHVLVTSLSNEDDGSYFLVEKMELDLEDLIRSDILLSFPTKLLCRDDCRGLCPICGKNRNEGDCGCQGSETDPRLSALKELLD